MKSILDGGEYEGEATHFTHSYLWSASQWALDRATQSSAPVFDGGLLALIAGALAVEAYLNYLAPKVCVPWGRKQEWMRPVEKLNAVCRSLGYALDESRVDVAAFNQLFRLRNILAHGRPEIVSATWMQMDWQHNPGNALDAEWMHFARPDEAYQLLGLVHGLLTEIGLRAGEAEGSNEYEPFADLVWRRSQPRPDSTSA